jgi:hypothetical protein
VFAGVVYPLEGEASKDTGRRVQRIGPLGSWSLDLSGKAPALVLATPSARYTVLRPAAAYKRLHSHLEEQAGIAFEVREGRAAGLGCELLGLAWRPAGNARLYGHARSTAPWARASSACYEHPHPRPAHSHTR